MSAPDSVSLLRDFFQTEDHTDWEVVPPSYDLQSWGSFDFNEYLRTTNLMSSRNANDLSVALKPLSKVCKQLNKVSRFCLPLSKYESGRGRIESPGTSNLSLCRKRYTLVIPKGVLRHCQMGE